MIEQGMNLIKKFGPIGLVTHYAISYLTLFILFILFYTNAPYWEHALTTSMPSGSFPRTGSAFALAFAAHKATLLVRIPLSVCIIPYSAKLAEATGAQKHIDAAAEWVANALAEEKEVQPNKKVE